VAKRPTQQPEHELTLSGLEDVPWHALETAHGGGEGVPAALIELANAHDDQGADAAYQRLDDVVVLGNTLFESAIPVIPFAQVLTASPRSRVRERAWDLLIQIASATDADGSRRLETAALAILRSRPDLSVTAASDDEPGVRHSALWFTALIEREWGNVLAMAQAMVSDPDQAVRALASDVIEKGPGAWGRDLPGHFPPGDALAYRQFLADLANRCDSFK
jgi:hypothetical protein